MGFLGNQKNRDLENANLLRRDLPSVGSGTSVFSRIHDLCLVDSTRGELSVGPASQQNNDNQSVSSISGEGSAHNTFHRSNSRKAQTHVLNTVSVIINTPDVI